MKKLIATAVAILVLSGILVAGRPAEKNFSYEFPIIPIVTDVANGIFGDCMADHATGDVYNKEDPWCITGNEAPALLVVAFEKDEPTTTPDPTQVTPTSTPKPELTPTPSPEKPEVTPAPTKTKKPHVTPQPKPTKEKCNKGEGNGGEGCDPGNHPEKGKNDEDGTTKGKNKKH